MRQPVHRPCRADDGWKRVRRRLRGARSSLSRTTSDFEILRPRDSASMSATKGSGNRTVRVFMNLAYYISDSSARQAAEPALLLKGRTALGSRRRARTSSFCDKGTGAGQPDLTHGASAWYYIYKNVMEAQWSPQSPSRARRRFRRPFASISG